ncbi:MAG: 3-isopropylmalate dehydrogenase [Selenomonas sp.]|nr:3-isopropylmalate dehydrogenase [Selenomonas sp.]
MGYKIAVVPGDGIGQEITSEAVRVLKAVDAKFSLGLSYETRDAGGTAYDAYGTPLPEDTLAVCKASDGVLFGAVGGTKWDAVEPALRPERAILGLRKGLGLYANLRPVKVADALIEHSPLKPDLVRGVDLVIVRELIGESEHVDGVERAWDMENYSVPEVERIARLAFETARLRRSKVTSVDKANVLATSRLWRRTVTGLAKDYADVALDHLYVDNCAMQLAVRPTQFDVVVTGNLFGDILSDEAAVIGGSIGLMPSASIGTGTSLFEPIHGSAPDIAGQGIANPLGTILSAAMLLRYALHEEAAAAAIEAAVDAALADGMRTADIYLADTGCTKVGTQDMTDAVLKRL